MEIYFHRCNEFITGLEKYPFRITKIPLVLAMIMRTELGNSVKIKDFDSEPRKNNEEYELYLKWTDVFKRLTKDTSPNGEKARQNANYLRSIFTLVSVECDADNSQISYFVGQCEEFVAHKNNNISDAFFYTIKPFMIDLISKIRCAFKGKLKDKVICDKLTLFENSDANNSFLSSYNEKVKRSSQVSFYYLLQMLEYYNKNSVYSIVIPRILYYTTPPILKNHAKIDGGRLVTDWLDDIATLSFPLGITIDISECGLLTSSVPKIKAMLKNYGDVLPEALEMTCLILQFNLSMASSEIHSGNAFETLKSCNSGLRKAVKCRECTLRCHWSGQETWIRRVQSSDN